MNTDELIAIDLFCTHQGVEIDFILALHERDLITITVSNEQYFLATSELPRIEQLSRMHYDLDINLEGLEAISHLLDRMNELQERLRRSDELLRILDPTSGSAA